MNLRYIGVNVAGTLLRGFPFPCKTGIVKIGEPDRNSPVLLTCNFSVTVERVKRALKGIDCYLLVANSRGINVWCAAAGGHFTNHDVISALKTSGIEELVEHRNVILPQLAAAGIDGRVIQERAGWNVIWGPVYAKNIPDFLKNNFKKSPEMREVKFPLMQRIEMGVMWAFPFSIIAALIAVVFWRNMLPHIIVLTWVLPFLIFLSFPLYSNLLGPKRKGGRVPLILEGVFISFLIIYSILAGAFSWGFILQWGFVSFVVILMISIDLTGSTPVYKSGLHEDRFLRVIVDGEKCRNCGLCKQVCPRNCYEADKNLYKIILAGAERCVQCGACIVQCPFDALYFKSPKGEIITPETFRKYKLNLLGKRIMKGEGI